MCCLRLIHNSGLRLGGRISLIPQDSAQEGTEHRDKETDNQESSGEIIQENHHHEPEGTLQETPEEFVQGTSTLAFTAHLMHPGNQEEMSKETVPWPVVMTATNLRLIHATI